MGLETIIQCEDTLTIDEGIELMVLHSSEYPTHGYNCACKDPVLRAVRKGLAQRYPLGNNVTSAMSNMRYLFDVLTY